MRARRAGGWFVAAAVVAGCGSSRPIQSPTGAAASAVPSQLNFQIQSAQLPETGAPSITFKVTDANGDPIDLMKEITASQNAWSPHFVLAQLEPTGTYTNVYEMVVQGAPYQLNGKTVQPKDPSDVQPFSDPPGGRPFPTGNLSSQGNGVYTYTFTAPPPTSVVPKLDRTKTFTAAIYGTRPLNGVNYPASATFNFVPAGGTATRYETITDTGCNQCHVQLSAHDNRVGTQLCITCHAGDQNTTYKDPQTGNDIDFRVMIHKIHSGANLPSVVNGTPYQIVGFQQMVFDFSDVVFPQDIRNCTTCHTGANAADWQNMPVAKACLACHDNVDMSTSPPSTRCGPGVTAPCAHRGGPQDVATANCAACHPPNAIAAAHVVTETAAAANFQYEITGVSAIDPATRKVTVSYRVFNPATQTNYNLKDPSGPFGHTANGDSRLAVDIGWPNQQHTNTGAVSGNMSPIPYGQPPSIDALANAVPVAGQTNVFQVTSPPLPAEANQGITVALEGHPAVPAAPGSTQFVRVPVTNAIFFANAAGGPGTPRQDIVVAANCNICHLNVTAHGNNRTGNTQVCAICHNANATDKATRMAAGNTSPEQPIDFKVLIHGIHADGVRPDFTIIGFGGAQITFPVAFPANPGNCALCHVGTTYALPIPPDVLDTTIETGPDPVDPADNVRLEKTHAVCLACHAAVSFTESTLPSCNGMVSTTPCLHTGGANPPACSICHGPGMSSDVAIVHPIRARVTGP